MSWIAPDTRNIEDRQTRHRIWIEWIKGAVSGAAVTATLLISLFNVILRATG